MAVPHIPGLDIYSPPVEQAVNKFGKFRFPLCENFENVRNLNEFKIVKPLQVKPPLILYQGLDLRKDEQVAVAKYHNFQDQNEELKDLLREIRILRLLKHPHIHEFFEHVIGDDFTSICLVMESCRGFLSDLLNKNVAFVFEPAVTKHIMQQLLTALNYIHGQSIIHRDICPENIMFVQNGILKVSNFRNARKLEETDTSVHTTEFCYQPIELLLEADTCGTSVDIWSAICILAQLLLKQPLFHGNGRQQVLRSIFSILGSPKNMWPEFYSLPGADRVHVQEELLVNGIDLYFKKLGQMPHWSSLHLVHAGLRYHPQKRLTAEECLSRHYFSDDPTACSDQEFLQKLCA